MIAALGAAASLVLALVTGGLPVLAVVGNGGAVLVAGSATVGVNAAVHGSREARR